ncbi:uncharacterized protein TNCV_1748181 [Trichonephila clavipes]|nr:uncharacterized protein TNCV_1748181 [Trichonephila clavipes]
MICYVVELLNDWKVDIPSWKYPNNLESHRVSSPGFGNDSKVMVIAPGTRYHQENTIARHRYGGAGWLVWGGIILGSRTDLHVQSVTMSSHIYRDVILEQHVRLFPAAVGAEFLFMDVPVPEPASATLTDTELLNLNSLYNALDLRFGQNFSKDYARLQMKTRHQKPEESLQEYAFEMQRLSTLAFSDFTANVREMISLEYFVDGLKDEEIQMAVRMAGVKDLKSALLYALKVEAATQASCIDRHSIREARVTADEPCESRCIKEIEKLKEKMQAF